MPPPQLQMETIRTAALALLRAASATNGHPLFGVNVPEHRFGNVMSEAWPVLKARVTRESGAGVSRQVPDFVISGELQIGGVIGAPRSSAPALDTLATALAAAVQTTLLEDPQFLGLFGWVERIETVFDDDVAARDGAELDVVFFQLEIEVGFQQTFDPRAPGDLSDELTMTFESILDQPR
ncbi:MAG: hypothetical protein KIS73_24770 [Enhydrobacter sp.]|nr:hypothetical protein [Enhydrobacter sp.]